MGYFLAALFLIFQLVFPHYAYAAAAPAKFIIGYAAMSARVVPLWIAEEQGILAKYGVDSEQVFIRGAPTLVAGLDFRRHSLRQHGWHRHLGGDCSGARSKNGCGVFQPQHLRPRHQAVHQESRRVARQTIRRHQYRRHGLDGHHALARAFRSR